ncbi:partitioning defective 3 homolog [Patiria miniata]|uniref:PDZ domain-containing protein n=1 Tax=Patiria miniata TaxID=46514 RepID=A0A913Z320_PATMI|nr:partitioning defective 3 homolog [Patiria miniata]
MAQQDLVPIGIETDDYWVRIRSLKSEGEEAILDTDDLVCDVADDREKLIATFDEQDGPRHTHLIPDGTSTCASSVGTASPPLTFHSLDNSAHTVSAVSVNGPTNNSNNNRVMLANHYGDFDDTGDDVDVVVTGDEISTDPKLRVRRGSDPIMPVVVNGDPEKWNGTDSQPVDSNANSISKHERQPSLEMIKKRRNSRDNELNSAFQRFGRNSSRQSISNTLDSDVMYKWAEAQQKMEKSNDTNDGTINMEMEEIIIKNDGTPLGIQIIARVEHDDDSAYGLVIHGIETGGRAARDGRLQEGDHILTINKLDITEMTFDSAQELLRDAMRTESVALTVEREAPPQPEATPQQDEITDTPKVPPTVPARAPATSLSKEEASQKVHNIIAPTNTRRIGRKLYVQLMKGPQGLGFSITTRDNAVGGKNPIYIKNILPKGAAIADGRCKPGDRLLEVNGIEMTGKTQSEAVSILRSVRLGGVVNLVLSRQDANSPSTSEQVLPRELPEEKNTDDPTNAKNKRVLVFDIPLNDTGSAGLGVSVKGKTSGNGMEGESKDLGIFIKSVIHGGAASKDGRLRPNDQLLYINEESLVSISNGGAMEILRRSMSGDKSPRATIRLVVARRVDPGETTPDRQTTPGRAESVDEEGRPESPVSVSSRAMDIDMDAMDELFKHPVLNKLNALEKSESSRHPVGPGGDGYVEDAGQLSPTMPKGGAEVVMIEDADIDDAIAKIDAAGPSSAKAPSPPQWLVDTWEKAEQDNGELSPVDDPYNQFQRDSFARRSFSERHKGSLDAKEMAWYKRKYGNDPPKVAPKTGKSAKGDPQQKDIGISTGSLVKSSSTDNLADTANLSSMHRLTADERRDIGPSLGLKKNSSLESLQAAVAEVTTRDDRPTRPRAKVVRGRGCNESFRAAVDRSYDQPLNGSAVNSTSMDSVKENGHAPVRDDRSSRDDHSSVSSHDPVIMNRTNSSKKNNKKEKEKDKRKSGGFKGFGSMFRFGKHRRPERDGKPGEEERDRSTSVSSDKSKEDMEKYKEQQEEQNSRIQEEVRKLREQRSVRSHKEESEEARHKAERMQELRQRYQRDHRERQGRYRDDDEDDDDDDDEGGGDKDEGYGDGSPTSPRSPGPHSPHRDVTGRHAPEYRNHDQERWERQSEGNHRRGSHSQDDNRWPDRRDEYPHGNRDERQEDRRDNGEGESRHRYGRHSVPPYMESRSRNEPRGNTDKDRNRESRTTADVHNEPHYASVARRPRPDKNVEPSARDRRGEKTLERERVKQVQDEHPYASVERRDPPDRNMPKRSPNKIYESVDGDRQRDHAREDRNGDDWYRDGKKEREHRHRDDRHREDRPREERYQEIQPRDKRYQEDDRPRDRRYDDNRSRNDRYYDDRHQEDRYRNDRHREDRYRDDRHGDRPDGRKADRRDDRREDRHEVDTARKHNDPDKVNNSDAQRKRKESETLSRKDSDATKGKETLKRKDSDKASKDKKSDKSKAKETDKKDKEEPKMTRRKSDKEKKKEKEKEKDTKKKDKSNSKDGKSKDKDEKVSSEEEKSEERNAEPRRDRRDDPRRDARHHEDRRGDTMDRRHRGERERGTGDGRDHRREDGWHDGRRDGRERHRSPPPGDKYGYGSLGRPARRRPPSDPNQTYNRGTRESGYQSDHDRHRQDNHYDSNHHPPPSSSNHKGYANGPTSNHYPEHERRPRMTSSQSIDHVRDRDYREDYGSLKHKSRSERRMHYSESGLDHDAGYDAARV